MLIRSECIAALKDLPDASIDAIVTDPPYELGFMGKSWDNAGIAYSVEMWAEALRVLKPGGHLLAFGATRTYHRMACAIEDAGFEIRDSIHWIYGSGFPKSLDVSKAIDKKAGAEREVVGIKKRQGRSGGIMGSPRDIEQAATIPATIPATIWQGWGTALKPAHEPIVVARKPLIGTVAANVLAHGTGAINVDGCRVGTDGGCAGAGAGVVVFGDGLNGTFAQPVPGLGRWPANIVFDEAAAAELDAQSGVRPTGAHSPYLSTHNPKLTPASFSHGMGPERNYENDASTGGASRFFYCAKASKAERNAGLDGLEGKQVGAKGNGLARTCATCGASVLDGCECEDRTFVNPTRQNFHPTVKPVALMRWLVRLVTPPGGTVLDPFTGSGTTGVAAILEGFDFIGCEMTEDYWPIIEARFAWAKDEVKRAEMETPLTLF